MHPAPEGQLDRLGDALYFIDASGERSRVHLAHPPREGRLRHAHRPGQARRTHRCGPTSCFTTRALNAALYSAIGPVSFEPLRRDHDRYPRFAHATSILT